MIQLKELILSNFEIGMHESLPRNEKKLIKLLNLICFTWYNIIIFFAITDYFWEEQYIYIVSVHTFQFIVLICVQVLQQKQKYKAARVLFVSISFIQFFIFCNFILRSHLIEFFYILIPLFSLLFLKEKWYHYFYLALVVLSFMIPRYLIDLYDNSMFGDPTTFPILFIAIFLLVIYFKNLNIKNEKILEEKNQMILEDKKLIENQKRELEEFQNFQNQFFINVAHEIRTPLTILNGHSNKIKKILTERDYMDVSEPIIGIQNQSQKIQKIVDDVLDLCKMESKNFRFNTQSLSIIEVIQKVYTAFFPNFQTKDIEFHFINNLNTDVFVDGDAIFLERVFNNLISNALKYTSRGSVKIILSQKEKETIEIRIKDSGIGIKEKSLLKIFNRFYQEDNSINRAGGSGIGLSFCKEVIEGHKGKICVESFENMGSDFYIHLPILESQKNVLQISNEPQTQAKLKEKTEAFFLNPTTILLVEDQLDMQDYLRSILIDSNVVTCNDGLEALTFLEHSKPDLIITDYMMPNMNGYDFVLELKKRQIICPVIVLTARADLDGKLSFLRIGIDDYLTKPFNEDELLIRVNHLLNNQTERLKTIEDEPIEDEENNLFKEDHFIQKIREIVESNFNKETFGVADLAEILSLTERTLNRKIKGLTGLTPNGLIREIKLLEARKLIENKEVLSLKELSFHLGLKNASYMSSLYENRFGVKPKFDM